MNVTSKILAVGCTLLGSVGGAIATEEKALIHFRADVQSMHSVRDASKVQWGLLFTTDDLVVVVPGKDETAPINSPRYAGTEFLNRMATVKGIRNGTTKIFSLRPGRYDWLVLLDEDGDGIIDGYVGTLAAQGPLASYRFWAGNSYFIDLDKSGALSFKEAGNLYAQRTTELARLAGLRPIAKRPPGDELRLWSFSAAIPRNFLIRLDEGPAGVRGDIVLWWHTRDATSPRKVPPGWSCDKHVVQREFRVCRAALIPPPDWAALLRDLEREDAWGLPDGSTLPSQRPADLIVHGTDLVVEVRRAGVSRAYTYALPGYLPGPHARNAERILELAWNFVQALEKRQRTKP